jgi:hypothetical protein
MATAEAKISRALQIDRRDPLIARDVDADAQ